MRVLLYFRRKTGALFPLLLAFCVAFCSICGPALSAKAESGEAVRGNAGESAADQPAGPERPDDALKWEDMYTARHVDFLYSSLYHEIVMAAEGGLAAVIKKDYEHARLNLVNGSWELFDNTIRLVFDSDASEKAEQVITLTNEYDPVIGDLMYVTATSSYVSSFERSYYAAWSEMLKGILEIQSAKNEAIAIVAGDAEHSKALEAADDLVYVISQFQTLVNTVNTADTKDVRLLQDKLEDLKGKLNETFDLGQLDTLVQGIGIVEGGASIIGNTASDVLDMCCLFQASSRATEEWTAAWKAIAREARGLGTREGEKISASIENMLMEIQTSKRSMATAVVKQGAERLAKNVTVTAAEFGFSSFTACIDNVPILRAIHIGSEYGVKLADAVTGMDDIAVYGNMMCTLGDVALAVYPCVVRAGEALEKDHSYENAKMFHEMYHIFRAVQVYACDTGISYSTAAVDNVLGHVFRFHSDDEIAGSVQLLTYKARLLSASCHEMSETECRNILSSWGYTNVSLERIDASYDYIVHADEVAHARYQLIADASTGYLIAQAEVPPVTEDGAPVSFTRAVANLWNQKRCDWEDTTDKPGFLDKFAAVEDQTIDSILPDLRFASWEIRRPGGGGHSCTILTYDHTFLDYVLLVDQVSGIAVSLVDDLTWGYYDFFSKTILDGVPYPPGDEEKGEAVELLAGGRMTREEADAAVGTFFGPHALEDFSFVNDQTEGLLLYIDTITQMTIEVNLDTGILRRISGSGIVYETFQFAR